MSKKRIVNVSAAILVVLGFAVGVISCIYQIDHWKWICGIGMFAIVVGAFIWGINTDEEPNEKAFYDDIPDNLRFNPEKGLLAWEYKGYGTYDDEYDTGMMYYFDKDINVKPILHQAGIHVSMWHDSGHLRNENGVVHGYSPEHARFLLDKHALRYPVIAKRDGTRSI